MVREGRHRMVTGPREPFAWCVEGKVLLQRD